MGEETVTSEAELLVDRVNSFFGDAKMCDSWREEAAELVGVNSEENLGDCSSWVLNSGVRAGGELRGLEE